MYWSVPDDVWSTLPDELKSKFTISYGGWHYAPAEDIDPDDALELGFYYGPFNASTQVPVNP